MKQSSKQLQVSRNGRLQKSAIDKKDRPKSQEGTYMFIVDCAPKYGKSVRARMEADGFETDILKGHVLLGDHIAIKHFKSLRAAKRSAQKFLDELESEIDKIIVDDKVW